MNRVGDRYFDQLARSGHDVRPDDIELFAGLGIRAIRFPVIWERTAPESLERADWSWADTRLERLRALDIRPIIGLVHHGSGPPNTSLLDPGFASGLAAFARAVASRYPWVEDFTPVNEPLTTARFSCLYGHWYPHARSLRAFARAVVVQSRAIVEAMRAIREITPSARLIQTEDGGAISSTDRLAYQAAYENHRQWLCLDLLAGRVSTAHPLHAHLVEAGVHPGELEFFLEHPCLPDIVGMNYYVVSDRFLDERLDLYPPQLHGGNGRDCYADTEAARSDRASFRGHARVLRDAWERYGRPVALTEVHLDGSRDEQLRWLHEAWQAAVTVADEGIDVRGVTLWALLGSFDWNALLVRQDGYYENGAFDVRGGRPRPTALLRYALAVTRGTSFAHPVLSGPGWWRRPDRLYRTARHLSSPPVAQAEARAARPILICGATGTLGSALARVCARRGLATRVLRRSDLDITDTLAVRRMLDTEDPWAVLNAAGFVDVDAAEKDRDRCRRDNYTAAVALAQACREDDIQYVTFSSDLVFDGASGRLYVETDRPSPLSAYGASKAEAEAAIRQMNPAALIVRTSAFFGPWDQANLLTRGLQALALGQPVRAAGDCIVSPTYVPDLANVTLDLLVDGETGIWHLANVGEVTWAELLRQGAAQSGLDGDLVKQCDGRSLGWHAPRPRYSVLGSERAALLPSLEDALGRYVAELRGSVSSIPGREDARD